MSRCVILQQTKSCWLAHQSRAPGRLLHAPATSRARSIVSRCSRGRMPASSSHARRPPPPEARAHSTLSAWQTAESARSMSMAAATCTHGLIGKHCQLGQQLQGRTSRSMSMAAATCWRVERVRRMRGRQQAWLASPWRGGAAAAAAALTGSKAGAAEPGAVQHTLHAPEGTWRLPRGSSAPRRQRAAPGRSLQSSRGGEGGAFEVGEVSPSNTERLGNSRPFLAPSLPPRLRPEASLPEPATPTHPRGPRPPAGQQPRSERTPVPPRRR